MANVFVLMRKNTNIYVEGIETADRQSTDQLLLMCADRGNNGILGLWDWSLNKHSVKGTSL